MPQAEVSAGSEGGWHLAWLRATNLNTGTVSMLPVDRRALPPASCLHWRDPLLALSLCWDCGPLFARPMHAVSMPPRRRAQI